MGGAAAGPEEGEVVVAAGGGGGYPGGGGRGGGQRIPRSRAAMEEDSPADFQETGGRFFEVTKKETVGDIYTSIVEELRPSKHGLHPDKDSTAAVITTSPGGEEED